MTNGRCMALVLMLGVAAAPGNAFVTPPCQAKVVAEVAAAQHLPQQLQQHQEQRRRQSTLPFFASSSSGSFTTEGQALSRNEEFRKDRRTVYTHDDWIKHRSPDRFLKNIAGITSSGVYQGVLSEVMATATLATLIVVFNACVTGYTDLDGIQKAGPLAESLLPLLSLPIAPFTLTTPALGLLLVFRTNSSYQRWDEARKNWGLNINRSRDLVRMGSAYYDREGVPDHIIQKDLDRLSLCTWAFMRSMKRHLSPEWEDEEAFQKELREKLPPKQADKIINAKHRPNRALQDLSAAIEAMPMNFIRKDEIHAAVSVFEDTLGSSERLLSSPVPLFYSRHTARFTALWLLALPFALYQPFEGTWNHLGMIPATAGISVALFGVEELANQLEEPFTLLPMQVYCDKIYEWCKEIAAIQPNDNKMFSDEYLAEIRRLRAQAERENEQLASNQARRFKRVVSDAERVASATSQAAVELAQAQRAAADIRAATERQAAALRASIERQAEQERQVYQRMAAAQQQMAWAQAGTTANGAAPPATNTPAAPQNQPTSSSSSEPESRNSYSAGTQSFMPSRGARKTRPAVQDSFSNITNGAASPAPDANNNYQGSSSNIIPDKDPMAGYRNGYSAEQGRNRASEQDLIAAFEAGYAANQGGGTTDYAASTAEDERVTQEAFAMAREAAAERKEALRQASEARKAAEQARAEKQLAERIATEARLAAEKARQEQVAAQKAVARAREQAKQSLYEANVARERAVVEKALADRQARAVLEAQALKRQQVAIQQKQSIASPFEQQQPQFLPPRNSMMVPMLEVDSPEDKISFRNTPFENFTNVQRRWN